MGVISEIIDVVNGIKDLGGTNSSVSKYLKNSKSTSINRMAKEGILQFPVLISSSVDTEIAYILTKALEKNYASLVQMAVSMNCVTSMDENKGLEDFIKRFDKITTAVKEIPYVCGYCYTQVADVQQEINGLMDIDRNFKVNVDTIKEINERQIGYWRKM